MKKILPLLLFLFTGGFLFAQFEFKSAKDSNGKEYSYIPDDPFSGRFYTLSNGMKLFLSKNDREPRIQTYIAVRAGSADDPAESTGLAHYFEHMMFKGNEKIASLNWAKEQPLLEKLSGLFEQHRAEKDPAKRAEIYKQIDAVSVEAAKYSNDEYWILVNNIGAEGTNAWTSMDETVYKNDIPANNLEKFLRLESERFRSIALRRFHTELETVYEEFNSTQDKDSRIAYNTAMKLLFGDHPYGRQVIGLPEHIKAPSMKDIHTFFKEHYNPDSMALILSGDLDYDKTAALAERYFGTLPAKESKTADQTERRKLAGAPLESVRSAELTGHQVEQLIMAFRFDATEENELMLDLISEILSNGKCGLFDKDLILPQKVLSVSQGSGYFRDFFFHIFILQPKQGQTLEQLRDMVLAELNKLKKGDFPDWLPGAVVNNMRLSLITVSEDRGRAAYAYVDSFIRGYSFVDALNAADKTAKITKQQITGFANKNFRDNYAIVYKRTGEPMKKVHAEKPPITPVPVTSEPSPFAKEFAAMPSLPDPEPVFPDFSKELYREKNYYAAKNPLNERFSVTTVFKNAGTLYDTRIPIAFALADYLGTKTMSKEQLQEELYKLAGNISYSSGYFNSSITVSGLRRNMDALLELSPGMNLEPDDNAMKELVQSILKSRENSKKDQFSVFNRASRFAFYGGLDSLANLYLPEEQLRKLTAKDMTDLLRQIAADSVTDLVYFGPDNPFKGSRHIPEDRVQVEKPRVAFRATPPKKNQVVLIDYPSAQTVAMLTRMDNVYEEKPYTFESVFGEYSSRKFWSEFRERRALAYSAGGFYTNPTIMLKDYSTVSAFIMTQGDKLESAVLAMQKELDKAEIDPVFFESAKANIISSIRNRRIHPEAYYGVMKEMERLNLKEITGKTVFRELKDYDTNIFRKEWQKRITERPSLLVILGDLKQIDRKSLEKFGKIRELQLNEIFRK